MGAYTNANFRCASCSHFVADHGWAEPARDANDDDDAHEAKRGAAESNRGACHANGAACTCKDYVDSGTDDLLTGSAAEIELKKLRSEKASADAAELSKLRADKAARDAAPAASPTTPAAGS